MHAISIIVPVYNVEAYLSRCVDSILAQTFTDFELILVDDGSTDKSGLICDEYAKQDNRVVVIHKNNGGAGAARNSGLDIAKGDYIAFVDSDDWIVSDFLERISNLIKKDNVDEIVFRYNVMNNDTVVRTSKSEIGRYSLTKLEKRYWYLSMKLGRAKHGWEVWNKCFKRSIIESNHIRFCEQSANYGEDYGFLMKFSCYADYIVSIEDVLYRFCPREGSLIQSSKNNSHFNELNTIAMDVWEEYCKVFQNIRYEKLFSIIHFLIMNAEYSNYTLTSIYSLLPYELKKIRDQKWYKKQVKGLFFCKKELVNFFGQRAAKQVLLFSMLCLHQNWGRFTIESNIAYRFFIKGD